LSCLKELRELDTGLDRREVKVDGLSIRRGKGDNLCYLIVDLQDKLTITIDGSKVLHVTSDGLEGEDCSLGGAIATTLLDSSNKPVDCGSDLC
jgi:hypothetical protein